MPTAVPSAAPEAPSTAERLLAAAESLVLQEGAADLRVRSIGVAAGLNPALVSYYFGGVQGLMGELLTSNVDIIHAARQRLLEQALAIRSRSGRFQALVVAYLDPVWLTPARWTAAPARAVVRELLPAVDLAVRQRMVVGINQSIAAIATQLQPLLPKIERDEIVLRLRLLSGATEMLQPRLDQLGLYPLDRPIDEADQSRLRESLYRFARGALRAR